VAWQDQATRAWHTIARLQRVEAGYEFGFTRGIERLRSIPVDLFRMDVNKRYRSDELMPLFKNKLLSRSRSDFAKLVKWLNLNGNEDEFDALSKFGLIPGTDSILVYPEPEIGSGKYRLEFFVHGIRHMHKDALRLCDELKEGDRLLPMLDVQNPIDQNAVAVRCESSSLLVGYIPTFYAVDLRGILSDAALASGVRIKVVRNNEEAPLQLRLLCEITASVPRNFQSLDTLVHRPIFEEAA
jgi:hypothetical protein